MAIWRSRVLTRSKESNACHNFWRTGADEHNGQAHLSRLAWAHAPRSSKLRRVCEYIGVPRPGPHACLEAMHKTIVLGRCNWLAWPQAARMDGGTAGHALAGGLVACARADAPGQAALAPLLLQLHLAVAEGARRTQDGWTPLMLLHTQAVPVYT